MALSLSQAFSEENFSLDNGSPPSSQDQMKGVPFHPGLLSQMA